MLREASPQGEGKGRGVSVSSTPRGANDLAGADIIRPPHHRPRRKKRCVILRSAATKDLFQQRFHRSFAVAQDDKTVFAALPAFRRILINPIILRRTPKNKKAAYAPLSLLAPDYFALFAARYARMRCISL